MDAFHRTPVLQVRDARLTTSRSELEDLKNFFDSAPPPDHEYTSRNGPASISKSTDNRKQSRKKFFNIGRKRLSNSDLEVEPYVLGATKRASALVPLGGSKRDLGEGHTVIMLGSPFPPPNSMKTPTLEITPSSPVMLSQATVSPSQLRNTSFVQPNSSRLAPGHNSPSLPPLYNHSTRPALSRGHSEVPRSQISRPKLVNLLSEKVFKLGADHAERDDPSSETPVVSPLAQVLPLSDSSFEFVAPPTLSQSEPTQAAVGVTETSPQQPNLPQVAKRPFSLILLDSHTEKVEQALARARLTKDESLESLETSTAEYPPPSPEQRPANRRAIYKDHSSSSTPWSSKAVPPGLGLPLTPPPSLAAVSFLPTEQTTTSIRSGNPKRRNKKSKDVQSSSTLAPHGMPMPDPDSVDLEIVCLEKMGDREESFKELAGMYMQQKKLRAAEEKLQRQKLADLTAGLMAQKMENLKLVQMLRQKGVILGGTKPATGIPLDVSRLVGEAASADTPVSIEGPNLDPSRFAMLRKEAQFGQIRDFSQSTLATLDLDESRVSDLSAETNSAQHLIQRVKMSGSMPLLSPAPSIPLPPLPNGRRNSHSMIVSNSTPLFIPAPRSRSLTETSISPAPYLDSFVIEQNMRRLERECGKSCSIPVIQSFDSSPMLSEDLFEFYGTIGSRGSSHSEIVGPFSLAAESAVTAPAETTVDILSAAEGLFNSELCISSGLTSSASTFQTAESSNDVDAVFATEATSQSPVEFVAITNERINLQDQNPFWDPNDITRTRHTIFTTVPSVGTVITSPNPRPASIDDSTWGALFMGLMRRADSRARDSSDAGEASSVRSVEA